MTETDDEPETTYEKVAFWILFPFLILTVGFIMLFSVPFALLVNKRNRDKC